MDLPFTKHGGCESSYDSLWTTVVSIDWWSSYRVFLGGRHPQKIPKSGFGTPQERTTSLVHSFLVFQMHLWKLGGGNSNIFNFHPYLGKIPILANIFQLGLKPPTRKVFGRHFLCCNSSWNGRIQWNCFSGFGATRETRTVAKTAQSFITSDPVLGTGTYPTVTDSRISSIFRATFEWGMTVPWRVVLHLHRIISI